MNQERSEQWLNQHLDHIRTMLRSVGRDLVAVYDEDPRCGEEVDYDPEQINIDVITKRQ